MVSWKEKNAKTRILSFNHGHPKNPNSDSTYTLEDFSGRFTFSAMGPNDKDFGKWSEPNLQGIMFHSYPIQISHASHPLESLVGFTSPGNASRRINSLGVKSLSSSASDGWRTGWETTRTKQRCLFFFGVGRLFGVYVYTYHYIYMWWKSTYIEIYIGSVCLFACLFACLFPPVVTKSHMILYTQISSSPA